MSETPGLQYIGLGYDIREAFADPLSTRARVLDAGGLPPLDELSAGEQVIYTSRTLSEQREKFSLRVGVETSYGNFSGSVSVEHKTDDRSENEYTYVNISDIVTTSRLMLPLPSGAPELLALRAASFAADSDALEPAALVAKYGTHVLVGVIMGGAFYYSSSFLRTESWSDSELATSSVAAYNTVIGSTRVEIDTEQINQSHVSTVRSGERISFRGGGPELGLKIGSVGDESAFAAWADSVPQHPELVDLPTGALVPIWEFVSGSGRQTTIRREIERMLRKAETPRWGVGGDKSFIWVPRGTTTADWHLITGPAQTRSPSDDDYKGIRYARFQYTEAEQNPSDHFRLDVLATGSTLADGEDEYKTTSLSAAASWMLVYASGSFRGRLEFSPDAQTLEVLAPAVLGTTIADWSLIVSPTRFGRPFGAGSPSASEHALLGGIELDVVAMADRWEVTATSTMVSSGGSEPHTLDVDYLIVGRGPLHYPLSVVGRGEPPLQLRVPSGETGSWAAFAAPGKLGKVGQDDKAKALREIDFDIGYRDAIRFAVGGEQRTSFWQPIVDARHALFRLGPYLLPLMMVGELNAYGPFSDLEALADGKRVKEMRFSADNDGLHAVGVVLAGEGEDVKTLHGGGGEDNLHQRVPLMPGDYVKTVIVYWNAGSNDDIAGIFVRTASGLEHGSPVMQTTNSHSFVAPAGYELAGFHGMTFGAQVRRLGVIARRLDMNSV